MMIIGQGAAMKFLRWFYDFVVTKDTDTKPDIYNLLRPSPPDDSFSAEMENAEQSARQKAVEIARQREARSETAALQRKKEKEACYQAGLKVGQDSSFHQFIKAEIVKALGDPNKLTHDSLDLTEELLLRLGQTEARAAVRSTFYYDGSSPIVMNKVQTSLTRYFYPEDWPSVVSGAVTSLHEQFAAQKTLLVESYSREVQVQHEGESNSGVTSTHTLNEVAPGLRIRYRVKRGLW